MYKKIILTVLGIILFLYLTNLNIEYLVNRESSSALTILAVLIEVTLITVFYLFIKKLFK